MKKIIHLLIVAFGSAGATAYAQEALSLGQDVEVSDPPPALSLPGSSGGSAYDQSDLPEPGEIEPEIIEPIAEPYSYDSDDSDAPIYLFGCEPALLESTGTWLRRGFWYTEVDAVILNRKWRKDRFTLMGQLTINNPIFGTLRFNDNRLTISGTKPGAATAPRMKLGRFLFRDHSNRDHSTEFVAYGGAQWSQAGRLDANPDNSLGTTTLFVLPNIAGGNADFTGATSSQYTYDSRFNSFELNYQVKSRMRQDRVELQPNGHWVRRANPSVSLSWLAGLRFFDMTENLNWDAFGFLDSVVDEDDDGETGNYLVRTDNDMFGTQIGVSWNYETARWSAGARAKGGMYLNRVNIDSAFSITGDVLNGLNRMQEDNISFIGEAALLAKWHLRPNFSLRAGFEILFLTQVATAPGQLNFIPSGAELAVASSGPTYLGGTIGFEGYW